MAPSRIEVEVKLRFDSARDAVQKLEQSGANLVAPRAFEDNRVYDLPSGELRNTSRLLRLRRKGTTFTLTFKSKVEGETRHKVYIEHETEVEDGEQMHLLLTGLGYAPWYRYQKYRTVYLLDDVEVSVDETPIGCFVELEGEGDAIDLLASRLGFTPDRYIRDTYHALHVADAAERGVATGDLLFAENDA
jgi:adenylate cyclase class 2